MKATTLQLRKLSVQQLKSRDPEVESKVADAISDAFGLGGPGILLVDGLDGQFTSDRLNLLASGRALSALTDNELQALEFEEVDYSIGWSRGRESFKGVVDTKKGSFYANPVYDDPTCGDANLAAKYPHYMNKNVWPCQESCHLLEVCFKRVGRYINEVGLHVARHCDQFIRAKLGPTQHFSGLEKSLQASRAAKGRLLNYFPVTDEQSHLTTDDKTEELWCGYHNDHGTLTGLIAGQFYNAVEHVPLTAAPDSTAGLYVSRRGSEENEKVLVPPDCIAFQIGEAAQIASGGVLRATPHAVRMPVENNANVARVTLAVFLQPNPWEPLQMPDKLGPSDREAALETSHLVPSLQSGRYEENDTFEQFASKTIRAYCT